MTRRNDRDLARRQPRHLDHHRHRLRRHPDRPTATAAPGPGPSQPAYVREHVELAYATTVHGAQGETTHTGHLLLGEHTTAAAAYVAMTRGRENNVAHLVAEDLDDARQHWVETFGRDRADLGPAHAATRAAEDLERYAPHRPLEAALGDLRAAWTTEQDLRGALARCREPPRLHGRHTANLPRPGPPTTAPRSTSFVTSSPPPPTRCAPSSTNPPSGPCPRAGSSKNTPTGSSTAEHEQQAGPGRLGARQPSRGPAAADRRHGYPSTPERGRGISR